MKGKPIVDRLVIGTCAGLVILAGCSSTENSRLRFKSSVRNPYTTPPGVTAMDAPGIDDSWKANLIQELNKEKQDRDIESDPIPDWPSPLRQPRPAPWKD